MSAIYPRTCTIKRSITPPQADTATGNGLGWVGYSATQIETANGRGEEVVVENVPCSIQAVSTGRNTRIEGVPSDAPGPVHWRILIPKRSVAKDMVRDRDYVYGDDGYRYHVEAAYWNSLGYGLRCIRLEV